MEPSKRPAQSLGLKTPIDRTVPSRAFPGERARKADGRQPEAASCSVPGCPFCVHPAELRALPGRPMEAGVSGLLTNAGEHVMGPQGSVSSRSGQETFTRPWRPDEGQGCSRPDRTGVGLGEKMLNCS